MIERRVARLAGAAADARFETTPPAAAQLAPTLVAARRAGLLNTRHVVPSDSPLDRQNGASWIV
jgi:hypothetical protein